MITVYNSRTCTNSQDDFHLTTEQQDLGDVYLLNKKLQKLVGKFKNSPLSKTVLTDVSTTFMKSNTPWDGFSHSQTIREKYRQPLTSLLQKMVKQLHLEQVDVLEIGAGALTNQHSYLSNIFPHRSWTFSDFVNVANVNKTRTSQKYLPIDLVDHNAKNVDHLYQVIVGGNVLDTIRYADLVKAFATISQMLETDGICIHVADLNLFGNSFFEAVASEKDCVVFPGDDKMSSIYKIKKSDCEKILKLKSHTLPKNEADFYNFWYKQDPLLQTIAILNYNYKIRTKRSDLIRKIKNLFSSHLELIHVTEYFERHLKQAALENGFTIEKCGLESEYLMQPKPSQFEENYHTLVNGNEIKSKCFVLAPKKLRLEAQVHIFIARKNKTAPQLLESLQ